MSRSLFATSRSRKPGRRRIRPVLEALEERRLPATFTVTSTADDGSPGTFRWALGQVNASRDSSDSVTFNIPGSGVQTIEVMSPLPTLGTLGIDKSLLIDGYTQPGASPNTLTTADNAVLLVELTGLNAANQPSFFGDGLMVTAGEHATVRGLVIDGFQGAGIRLQQGDCCSAAVITGNFIGTDPTGSRPRGNNFGVALPAGGQHQMGSLIEEIPPGNSRVGGTSPADRNVISGNSGFGVLLGGFDGGLGGTGDNLVQGNFIGVGADGVTAIPNGDGVGVDSDDNLIGGTAPGAGNVLAGNTGDGVVIYGNQNSVQGNLFGTGADGATAVANDNGVKVAGASNLIGGPVPAAGNLIAHNSTAGVDVEPLTFEDNQGNLTRTNPTGNGILGNRILANAALGIDLDGDGVTENDTHDHDSGPNGYEDFPVLTSVVSNPAGLTVTGTLSGNNPASNTWLEFFANAAADGSGHGQGAQFLGHAAVADLTFRVTLPGLSLPAGTVVSATATAVGALAAGGSDLLGTSEFSADVLSTEAAPGPGHEIEGQVFDDADGDGVHGPGEPGLDGVTVQLVDPFNGNVLAETTTGDVDLNNDGRIDPAGESGLYSFDPAPGTYAVRALPSNGHSLAGLPLRSNSFNPREFGFAVAGTPDGNVLVGDPIEQGLVHIVPTNQTIMLDGIGGAYVFDGPSGVLLSALHPSTLFNARSQGEARKGFGFAVAADADSVFVAEPFAYSAEEGINTGFVRQFSGPGGPEVPDFVGRGFARDPDGFFGTSLAVDGHDFFVGSPEATTSYSPPGSDVLVRLGGVYGFDLTNPNADLETTPIADIEPAGGAEPAAVGESVAVSDFGGGAFTVFAGAPGADYPGAAPATQLTRGPDAVGDTGAVLALPQGSLPQGPEGASPPPPVADVIYPPDLQVGDSFGSAIAARGSELLVGAPGTNAQDGRAYLYPTQAGGFPFGNYGGGTPVTTTLVPPGGATGTRFGFAVALVGPYAVVGAPGDSTLAPGAGAVHVFDAADGRLLQTLYSPGPVAGGQFGFSVAAVGDDQLVVGSPTGGDGHGIAYVFHLGTRVTANPGVSVEVDVGTRAAVGVTQPPPPTPTPLPAPQPVPPLTGDVTGQTALRSVGTKFTSRNGRTTLRLLLVNNSAQALAGPVALVLTRLPRRVRLRAPSGFSKAHARGSPYVVVASGLAPHTSVAVTLVFRNAARRRVPMSAFVPEVLAGPITV
jgi:hypothetical protein